jgi:hypothetical protein
MSAVAVFKEKVKQGGYSKRVEIEQKVASGELPTLTLSQRREKGFAPHDEANKKAAGILPGLNTAGLGPYIATVHEAIAYKNKPIPNYWLAAVTAARGVLILMDLGVDRNDAVAKTATLVGLPKELIEKALGTITGGGAGGGATAAGGAPGA